jgi:hypothetical protein
MNWSSDSADLYDIDKRRALFPLSADFPEARMADRQTEPPRVTQQAEMNSPVRAQDRGENLSDLASQERPRRF